MSPLDAPIESPGVAVQRRGRTRKLLWLATAASVGVFVGTCAQFDDHGNTYPLLLVSFIASLISAVGVLNMRFNPITSAPRRQLAGGKVAIDGESIVITSRARKTTFPRAAVASGWLENLADETTAVICLRDDTLISIVARSEAEGAALLDAAGVSAEQQVMRMRLEAPTHYGAMGCVAALSTLILSVVLAMAGTAMILALDKALHGLESSPVLVVSALITTACLALFYKLIAWVTPPLATVGTDGVSVRGIGKRRFIPYRTIREAAAGRDGVTLTFTDGRTTLLQTRRAVHDEPMSVPTAILFDRISAAMAVAARGASTESAVRALRRENRSFAEYREHLRSLTGASSGYRRATIDSDDLARVLEDGEASPGRRIAAALALSPARDPVVRQRIRAAVEVCADDELRAAIEAAAEDELTEAQLTRAARERR